MRQTGKGGTNRFEINFLCPGVHNDTENIIQHFLLRLFWEGNG